MKINIQNMFYTKLNINSNYAPPPQPCNCVGCYSLKPTMLIIAVNLLKPTGYVMHKQFNIQQLYVLPTLYLCVLCLSEKKQQLVPLTA